MPTTEKQPNMDYDGMGDFSRFPNPDSEPFRSLEGEIRLLIEEFKEKLIGENKS